MSPVFRRWLVVLVGASLLIGLTAGPLSAAKPIKKTYSVTVDPTTVPYNPAGVDPTFKLRYTNTTPGGIASFNSLTLTAPTGFTIDLTSVAVTTSSGSSGFSVATSATAPNVTVTNLFPVSYAEWVEVTFDATVTPSATTCGGSVGTWVTEAWTGSNTSGTLFELSGDVPQTTVGTLVPAGGSITLAGVTLTNVGTTCSPVSISRNANEVSVWKPVDPSLAFTVEVNAWDPEPATAPVPTARWTQVDTPGGFHDIEWCLGTTSAPALPGSEVSCLISQSSEIYGPDGSGGQLIQVTELILLTGDWVAKR